MSETATTTQVNASPHEVIARMIDLLGNNKYHEFADLFTPDAVSDMPFMTVAPLRHMEGRDTIRATIAKAESLSPIKLGSIEAPIVYETTDPELWFVEYTAHGTITTTGNRYTTTYFVMLRIVGGKIAYYRQYNENGASIIASSTPA